MYFKTSYEDAFDDLLMYLKGKYPEKLFNMDGIGEQTDMSKFSRKFFSSKVTADASIDANANVDDVSVIAYHSELPKPYFKINSYYMLWKELKRLYSLGVANDIIEKQITGDIYINDVHGIGGALPYCYNYSTYDIMTKGLPMIKKIKSIPPKHLYSFKSQLEQFTIIAANSTLGAAGLADMLVVMSYYVKNILNTLSDAHFSFKSKEDAWKYIEETLVSFIYTINQPTRGNQSCFTNISIYDDVFLNSLKEDYLFPDGTNLDVDIAKKVQELFLIVMNKELTRTPITFPVTTACVSVDDESNILDENFVKTIARYNKDFGFINIFCGKSSVLSSCCFKGSQKVLTKSSSGVSHLTFEELSKPEKHEDYRRNMTIFHNGSWAKGRIIKTESKDLYKITTVNNKEIIVTTDHLNPTLRGDISTKDITNEDYLLFNTRELDSYPEKDLNLTYEQGVIIGAYLGDGSAEVKSENHSPDIHFSLNKDKYEALEPIIKKGMIQLGLNEKIVLRSQYNNVYPMSIISKGLYAFIKTWVHGNYCYEKELEINCLLQSFEFRKGILDGIYYTDGGNSNRIYTTSKKLSEQLEVLVTSLGKVSIINISDRTDEPVVIRGVEYNKNHPLYCIRWYEPKNKRSMKDVYKVRNNSIFFKVKSIEKIEKGSTDVYCFEMTNTEEPYFTLPNGVITHNCRLRSDKSNEYFNSFGSGSSKIGSLGVCSINLPRLAFKHESDDTLNKFYNELSELVNICAKVNNAKRKLVQKRIDNGNHPLYELGFIDIQTQYSTVGINGFNECIEILGKDILTKEGQELGLNIIDVINKENDKCASRYKTAHNCEQIPAENVSIKLAQKDELLKYNNKYDIYSNQFIPLVTEADLLDRIYLQGLFDKHFSGGAIAHLNIDSPIKDEEQIVSLIKTCAKQGVVYFAINYNLQECELGHMSVGKNDNCNVCGSIIVNNYTRVVGFLVNTKNFHSVRRELDYPNRIWYKGERL